MIIEQKEFDNVFQEISQYIKNEHRINPVLNEAPFNHSLRSLIYGEYRNTTVIRNTITVSHHR